MTERPNLRRPVATIVPLTVAVHRKQLEALEIMVDIGNYGETVEEAAAYLISRGLDDMLRPGLLRPR